MIPSSGRVKLNRAALKDSIGLKLKPRRRRVSKLQNDVTADSKKQEKIQLVSKVESVEDTDTVPTCQRVTETTGNIPEGEPGENCVDFDRNTNPSPTGLAGSDKSLGRDARVSHCDLHGDCKCISPEGKTGNQGLKRSRPELERQALEIKIKKENTLGETSKKIIIWINQYPKLALCDVSQKCDAFSHDCGYMLPPDVLQTKVVHCFKQDMRAGFRFRPCCSGHNEHKHDEHALAENRELCPRAQSEKSVCESQSLTERQRHLKELPDAQTLSSHTTCRFLKSWTSEGSATCSASFLLGKCTKKGKYRTGMWDSDVEKDPGSRSHLQVGEIRRDKRIKLGDSVKDGILPSNPDLESIICKTPVKPDFRDQEKTSKCSWVSGDSQSGLDHADGGSSSFCSEMDSPQKTDAVKMSSEVFFQRNEVHTDEPELCTCQRVRAYFGKNKLSCARTYMSWPFSNSGWTLTAHAGTTAGPAEPVAPSPRDISDSPINQKQPGSSSRGTNVTLPSAPTDPSTGATHQVSYENETREEDGNGILAERNGKIHDNMSSYSSDSKTMEFAPHLMEGEESLASLSLQTATLSNTSPCGREPGADSVFPSPTTDSYWSTPSPSALGLSEWDTATTLSSMSSPFTHGGVCSLPATPSSLPPSSFLLKKVKSSVVADASSAKCVVNASEKPFHCEETQTTLPHDSDSFRSCESSLILPQNEQESDEELLTSSSPPILEPHYNTNQDLVDIKERSLHNILEGRSPPKLEPHYNTSPTNQHLVGIKERSLHNILTERCIETDLSEFMLPQMLSPVATPQRGSQTSFLPQSPGCSEEEEEINNNACHMPQIVNGNHENFKYYLEHGVEGSEGVSTNFKITLTEPQSSPSNDEDEDEEESQDESDYEDDVAQVKKTNCRIKGTLTSGVLTEPCSSPSSDEDDGEGFSDEGQPRCAREEASSAPEISGGEADEIKAEAAGNTQQAILDEFTAFEQDILLVDVIQFDPELFENLPQESLLKLGPSRVTEALKTRPVGGVKAPSPRMVGASLVYEQRLTPVGFDFHCDSPEITEESNTRPWRPQCSTNPSRTQSNTWPATVKQTKATGQPDANNNNVNGGLESSLSVQRVNSSHNHIPSLMTIKNGPRITNPANVVEFRRQKFNNYCRQYFSESLSCGFKMCRFQHVPVEGDEKFCIETVTRFIKIPICLQKAGAVFTGYYQNNPPGAYFSTPVLLSLLWALLKAGMVPDVFTVLSVSVAHKIVPSHEFLLALFNLVRVKGLIGFVPELMQLTFKMASAGLVLSLDCLDFVKNTPEFQQTIHPNSLVSVSGNCKLYTSAPFPEYLNWAHAIVEIELCTKQEDWRQMGKVFRSICQSSQPPNQVERISGRVAIALLSESKDKLSLPFATFAETVCHSEGEDSLSRGFLGRIGVSLMLRYYKTHQWAKGRRVVEVLSISKVNYSTLKGLFGNEDGASRCCLVTVATELFLLSGSVEGALNKLRENKWFLSSCTWPCEPADLESRTRVLLRLAEKTSHRDTLDVLRNLPGLQEPNDSINVSRYSRLFNSHLQVCVDRQMLPVASDTVDFMLSKNLAVDHTVLQVLLHKLGKQNLWLRAREVFRYSLSVGYYPEVLAPPGFMSLVIPCRLGEVELALTFEMSITVNAASILALPETTTSCLSITLKRTESCESEYLSAGSRLLSAACIPQPKLIIHYTGVNASQEQVFTLDISSARCWLRHNHLWANEIWTH